MSYKIKLQELYEANISNEDLIIEAIKHRFPIKFHYSGHAGVAKGLREVHPYVLGRVKGTKNMVLRGFQVSGDSASGDRRGWKLFLANGISKISIVPEIFNRRPDYSPDDSGMSSIYYNVN